MKRFTPIDGMAMYKFPLGEEGFREIDHALIILLEQAEKLRINFEG